MAFTPKQERNGADMGGGGQDTALPGPSALADIAAAKAQAEAAGLSNMAEGHAMAGATLDGHTVSFEWDAGLAINDNEGGGSG
jgi:hypothetical protein